MKVAGREGQRGKEVFSCLTWGGGLWQLHPRRQTDEGEKLSVIFWGQGSPSEAPRVRAEPEGRNPKRRLAEGSLDREKVGPWSQGQNA